MKRIFLLLSCLALFMVVGCSRKAVPATIEVRDSIRTEIKYRDVPVPVPGEKVKVIEYIECDSVTNKPKPVSIKAKGKKAFVNVTIDKQGKLEATGGCDSLVAIIQAQDKEIFQLRHRREVKIQKVHEPRWYDIAARWISLFTLLGILLLILVTFLKLKNQLT